jgi:hypothetical protein
MLFAGYEPFNKIGFKPCTRIRARAVYYFVYRDKFLAAYKPCTATLRLCPFIKFLYPDKFPSTYKPCTAIAPARNKLCIRTAKSTPYLSCHRDNIAAEVPGLVAGWLRQVTQPPFIAGPLAFRPGAQLR